MKQAMKTKRDFNLRSLEERETLLSEVWCPRCQAHDLGLDDPEEYDSNGFLLLEGKCTSCGTTVVTEILEPSM